MTDPAPQIRYARTSDGVSIAYYAMGDGPPLIGMSAGLHQSIEFDGKASNLRQAAETSARVYTYIRYDARGSGLSDRDVSDFSLEAMTRDLTAVADAMQLETFRLFAPGHLGMAGMAYAALHPERVSRLVIWASGAHGRNFLEGPLRPIRDLVEIDWRAASEALIQTADNWDNPELARENATMMRASVEPSTYLRYLRATEEWDLEPLLGSVACPTLVIHPANNAYFPVSSARRLAAGISGARLALVDSPSVLMPGRDVLRLAGQFFLDRQSPSPQASGGRLPSGTAIILFADIADSTALTERMGDAAFRAKARELDVGLRDRVRANGGTVIDAKTLGDGILATFPAASQAIAAALSFEQAARASGLSLHVGIHAGDVIREQDNVFGGAVNIAARISALSAPGEVLVSDVVRVLGRTSAGVTFDDHGEHELKGIVDPVRVFAVR